MRIAITGHRPNKLGSEYDGIGPYSNVIRHALQHIINKYKPTQLISGMALGVDMLWAELAITNKIPLVCAIPCNNQDSVWPAQSRARYSRIINWSKDRTINGIQQPNWSLVTSYIVSPGSYTPQCMQARNIWMVDNSDMLIAIWDDTSGGTANCVHFAQDQIASKRPDYQLIKLHPKKLLDEHNRLNQGYPI